MIQWDADLVDRTIRHIDSNVGVLPPRATQRANEVVAGLLYLQRYVAALESERPGQPMPGENPQAPQVRGLTTPPACDHGVELQPAPQVQQQPS